jgi:hypothetical protein
VVSVGRQYVRQLVFLVYLPLELFPILVELFLTQMMYPETLAMCIVELGHLQSLGIPFSDIHVGVDLEM